MAITLSTSGSKSAGGLPSLSPLEQSVIRVFNTIQNWTERRRARAHLYRMPDYMLRDIGVSRSEVAEEYEKPFWRE